ncbi:VOC family protein [uncultured Bacteroides sp.]|uniref:VOC family protein n=1 Tax=uncultured Bacteroides sp. TaxID=162156 RepID=UPI002AABB03C|nr:VOC family protein [uncultured Bacteroides sp.]
MDLNVHLVFNRNCEEAFNTYKRLFNGEIVFVFRKGEDKTAQVDETEKDKISHMVMNTEKFSIQGEDTDIGTSVSTGSSKLVLVFKDLKELQNVFNVLSEGGTIVSPLEKTFFSESIGEVIDKFGIRWLIMMTDEDYGK